PPASRDSPPRWPPPARPTRRSGSSRSAAADLSLGADHHEDHLEPRDRLDGVGLARGQLEQLAGRDAVDDLPDGNLGGPVHAKDHRVVRRGMLAQALAGVERERGDRPGGFLDQGPADDGARLILDESELWDHAFELAGLPGI